MAGLELILLCLAVSAALRIVAERLKIPYAAILVFGGLVLFALADWLVSPLGGH